MNTRQEKILNLLINNYIETAEPVGSRFLLSGGKLDCGEATIRNELRDLEKKGYLTHPHTSAGRMPTQKGYRYFVDSLDLNKTKLSKKENNFFGQSVSDVENEKQKNKQLARVLAELSNQAVIVAFSPDSVYYTGLANLFSQPEFQELSLVTDVSQIFDHCENCLEDLYELSNKDNSQILIGDEHPLGDMLSIIVGAFKNKASENGLVTIVGSMRMDYSKNQALLNKLLELA